ncbi:MAG TPA: hypothetical protein VK530_15525 [Candidatus Acidoferrum sp.]|nr:hypothetical protein [Candidatus Acidoferrum sp.]
MNCWLPVLAGAALLGAAVFLDLMADIPAVPQMLRIGLVAVGCAFAVVGIASWRREFHPAIAKAALATLASVFTFATAEAGFRLARFDFARFNEFPDEVPIYYRPPTLHAGDGVFRRPGPAAWRGKALSAYMRIHGADDGPYTNEQTVVVEYDALGFRNSPNLTDWDVVVTGDSFVELGFLPYETLFTTLAAEQLGIRIKNLGVSCTGPISQTFYVKNYGKGASTRDAVLCFYEGNDLNDLDRELRNRESFRSTGKPFERQKQSSLLKALFEQRRLRRVAADLSDARITPNAVLVNTQQERPMTVYGAPPVWDRLGARRRDALIRALTDWAETVRAQGMRPWVMYLPDSHRVFHGYFRYSDPSNAVHWPPGDFGTQLGTVCTNLNIEFIDTFPTLRHEAESGRAPYNLIGDMHLSAEGSRVVADVLAGALRKHKR